MRSMSALRRTWSLVDGPLTAAVVALIGLGLLNLYSATRVAPKGMFSSQLMWIAIGLVLLVGVAVLDQQLLKRLAWPAYLGVTGLLVAVLLVGKVVNGSRRWFGWGSYGIQAVRADEAVADSPRSAPVFRVIRRDSFIVRGATSLKWHALWIVPALLILKQPDLGTALLCGLLALSLFFLVPVPPKLKLWGVFRSGCREPSWWCASGSRNIKKKRLLTFLHPELGPDRHRLPRAAGPVRNWLWEALWQGLSARAPKTTYSSFPSTGQTSRLQCGPKSGACAAVCCCWPASCF
jgi:rod shape determining protein RodA